MRVICDAPGQTCNRLWTYVASVAQCIAERRRMVIIFYDWTIEDFPRLLHAKFIYFPLWHKWYLEHGNGWNNYKGLTWKVTHSKRWDNIFRRLGFVKGWQTRTDTRYLKQTMPELKRIFCPKDDIVHKAEDMMAALRKEADLVVGIHIRRGDYATWNDGRFFYELEDAEDPSYYCNSLYLCTRRYNVAARQLYEEYLFDRTTHKPLFVYLKYDTYQGENAVAEERYYFHDGQIIWKIVNQYSENTDDGLILITCSALMSAFTHLVNHNY